MAERARAGVRPGAASRRSPSPLNCRRCTESAVLDELAVTALGCVIVAGRGRGAAIGIGHRVGVSPRSMAERARASVRPGAASRRSPSPLNCRRCTESAVLDELAVTALGCVIVPVVVAVQLLASVTV